MPIIKVSWTFAVMVLFSAIVIHSRPMWNGDESFEPGHFTASVPHDTLAADGVGHQALQRIQLASENDLHPQIHPGSDLWSRTHPQHLIWDEPRADSNLWQQLQLDGQAQNQLQFHQNIVEQDLLSLQSSNHDWRHLQPAQHFSDQPHLARNVQDEDDAVASADRIDRHIISEEDRRYGLLDDLVESALQHQDSSQFRSDSATSGPADASSSALTNMIIPGSSAKRTESGRRSSTVGRFPGNVKGIVVTGPPRFLTGDNRANRYKNLDSAEWQAYINRHYFANHLQWLKTTTGELDRIKRVYGKAGTNYVLPAVSEGMPNLRLHRHRMQGSNLFSEFWTQSQNEPGSSIISIWGDPILQVKKPSDRSIRNEKYQTIYFGIAALKGDHHAQTIKYLEDLIQAHPVADVVRFTK